MNESIIAFPGGNILFLGTKLSRQEDFKVFRVGSKYSVTELSAKKRERSPLSLFLGLMYSDYGDTQPYNIVPNSKGVYYILGDYIISGWQLTKAP